MLYKTSFYNFLANITVDGHLSLTANRFGTEWRYTTTSRKAL